LEALGDFYALEGHALGVGFGEHFAELGGFGFDLHPGLFHFIISVF
jgi:hypothetical protein